MRAQFIFILLFTFLLGASKTKREINQNPSKFFFYESFDYKEYSNVLHIDSLYKKGGSRVSNGYWAVSPLVVPLINLLLVRPQWHIERDLLSRDRNRYCKATVYDGNSSSLYFTKHIDSTKKMSFRFYIDFRKKGVVSFFIDSVEIMRDSNSHFWQDFSCTVLPGKHTFTWTVSPYEGRADFGLDEITIGEDKDSNALFKKNLILQEKTKQSIHLFNKIVDSISDKIEVRSFVKMTNKGAFMHIQFTPSVRITVADYPSGYYAVRKAPTIFDFMKMITSILPTQLIKQMDDGDTMRIKITGMTDATRVNYIPYKNEYGMLNNVSCLVEDTPHPITISKKTGVRTNIQLAFLRVIGVEDYITKEIIRKQPVFDGIVVSFERNVEVAALKGKQFRKITVEMILPVD